MNWLALALAFASGLILGWAVTVKIIQHALDDWYAKRPVLTTSHTSYIVPSSKKYDDLVRLKEIE